MGALFSVGSLLAYPANAHAQAAPTPSATEPRPAVLPKAGVGLGANNTAPGLRASRAAEDPVLQPTPRGIDIRDTPVAQRMPAGYDPIGIILDGFKLFPEATLTVGADSNVFAEEDGQSDIIGRLILAATLESDWSHHSVSVDANLGGKAHAKFSEANSVTYKVHAAGRLDTDARSFLTADVGVARIAGERNSIQEVLVTREPVIHQEATGGLGGQYDFGLLTVGLKADVTKFDYSNSKTLSGASIDQQYRDYTQDAATLDLAYSIDKERAVFVSMSGNKREYRLPGTVDRDGQSYEILMGVRSHITPLIRGQLGIGYLYSSFDDKSVKSRGALGFDTRLDYLVTGLTTINFSARRYMTDNPLPSAVASMNTKFALGVDYELYRNVVLSAKVRHEYADYIGVSGSTRLNGVGLGAEWLVDRHYKIGATLEAIRTTRNRVTSIQAEDVAGFITMTYRP
jgi:hypothetical protein